MLNKTKTTKTSNGNILRALVAELNALRAALHARRVERIIGRMAAQELS